MGPVSTVAPCPFRALGEDLPPLRFGRMPPQPFPQPRIDTLVTDAVSGEQRRRTEYSGTLWWGQPPEIGRHTHARGGRWRDGGVLFLPDSLPYRRAELANAQVSCTAAVQALTAEFTIVTGVQASFADDPRGGDLCWLELRLALRGGEPSAISYRVVALSAPGAVAG